MTDEEKQAIEKLHNGKKMDLISIIRTFKREGIEKFVVTKKETVETVLNLIEKQQRIIEEQKSRCSHLGRDAQKAVDYTFELNKEIEKKDKMIDKIQKEVRDHIGFENRLKRDNKEPDLFNQGRFYVANNINNILKGKVENGN